MNSKRNLRILTALGAFGLFLASPETAFARCRSVFLSLFPQGTAVSLNARVFLHGGGELVRLAQSGAFVLRGPRGVVTTRVVFDAIQTGTALSQRTIVLAPTAALQPNSEYRLGLTTPALRTALTYDMRDLRFRTGTQIDTTPPTVRHVAPTQFTSVALGCGPSNLLPIHIDATDDSGVLFAKLRVAATDADLTAGRVLMETVEPVSHGEIPFGHGMCSGNFDLNAGHTYAAEVTVIDAAGNEAPPVRVTLRS
jgi:hypothetical protein